MKPFTNQIKLELSEPVQLTEYKSGWVRVAIDSGTAFVFKSQKDIDTNKYYKIDQDNKSFAVQSVQLDKWFIVGADGGEKVFVIGAGE